ncbi:MULTISPECIES: pyridoxal phosphate-dependent aminotransferase [unclassified Tolypothrix]|uniref:pyridoxal phosphate-dependent aminotransferase n=1 Tax=unclassified Tolypothrix TaxID=2649714 RepID=UPI0005EAAEEA|nr:MULTISPECIES: pyridoxal phosphate-dependent aminotransferase [unclassified Tolypothrix]BAY91797.1 aspartate aminotransferase [Microchaete diplosiphon NIES-3275]EKF05058.1 putative transaminase [Tolypothrix sp. PCC 7601]MBE9083617.1 pyridoxal phosphate-dependent aminotransferase [Tolypothrix sp. LEGE 11397]UYD25808.1 pyridoxal phosphate-dependent aminotransferase [Tolypothrix sp. PCC 7712]UYD31952.1 pyridoxal phosphate-dependent aminotransferase [Tolypothrix sp. PCC 7601]
MQFAKRLEKIPPYLFAEINRKRHELEAKGVDIINLAIGDPDKPTPAHILQAMHEAIDDAATHNYPPYQGTQEFREAAAKWMERRFGVADLNPNTEVVCSIGSKEAIHNTFLAFVETGDYTLIPDPGYPVYRTATLFAGGEPYTMPLKAENKFLPDLNMIPEEIAHKTKLLWINYPNNPTGAIATLDFFAELVAFCKQYDILLCHDNAYSEMAYDGYKPPSVLEVPGAKDVAIEFHSLSKSYNMTGWRIGFAVGNPIGIKGLTQVKSNVDSGVFKAIQQSAIAAYSTNEAELQSLICVYQNRRDIIVTGLQSLGWPIQPPQATLYVWVPVPPGYTSTEFVTLLLDKCGILVPPGNGYGTSGEGFFRIALTITDERMHEAIQRLKDAGIRYEA